MVIMATLVGFVLLKKVSVVAYSVWFCHETIFEALQWGNGQSANGISINGFMTSNFTWTSLLLIWASLLALATVTFVITIKYMVDLMKAFYSFALGIVLDAQVSPEFFLQVAILHAFIIVTMACAFVFMVYTHFPFALAQNSFYGCCSPLGSIFHDLLEDLILPTFLFFILEDKDGIKRVALLHVYW